MSLVPTFPTETAGSAFEEGSQHHLWEGPSPLPQVGGGISGSRSPALPFFFYVSAPQGAEAVSPRRGGPDYLSAS